MSYLFFDANPARKFDTYGYGAEGSLGGHLGYLANEGGTADCWDSTDTACRFKAMNEAKASMLHLYVVNESMYRVVGEVNR
ncbi:MAG: hypothetical protein V7749_00920 [Cocleimonas sp.]